MTWLEVAANLVNTASIVLAGRNSVHTWWIGIVGCVLFGWLFADARLYADATLQIFFVGTSVIGWRVWARGARGPIRDRDIEDRDNDAPSTELPVGRTNARVFGAMIASGVVVALGYGYLLHRFTDAWSPFVDSVVLSASVVAQLLLMRRRLETWPCWLFVNTLAVPLFWSRGLYLTSALYALYWINAVVSYRHWRRLAR